MEATMWVHLQVEVEVKGRDLMDCRQKAVNLIDDFTPEQMEKALDRAKTIGESYPEDVTEWVE